MKQIAAAVLVAVLSAVPAWAEPLDVLRVAEEAAKWPIKPSEAALIAARGHPGAVVLDVKLLPNGEYAVTLKTGGNVLRVLVNASTGAAG